MPKIGVSKTIIGFLVADVSTGFLMTRTVKKKTSMQAIVIDIEIVKIAASFLTIPDKSLNSNLFCYSYNM